jgi:hypothetical protein
MSEDVHMMMTESGKVLAIGSKKNIVALSDDYMAEVKYRETLKLSLKKELEEKHKSD